LLSPFSFASNSPSTGNFENHGDIGTVLHPGSVAYDAANHGYTIAGSGENMWFTADAFQFVWKKVSGDVTLTADISFVEPESILTASRAHDPAESRCGFRLRRPGIAR